MPGETWEMVDPASGQPQQASVTESNDNAIILVTRRGRNITFPRRSFLLMWNMVAEAPEQECAHAECTARGYLQIRQLGNWVWVCREHVPAGTSPLLGTDRPGEFDHLPGGLDQCPSCQSSLYNPGSESNAEGGYTLHRCGECQQRWSILTGEGEPEDGFDFADQMQDIAGLFEERGLAVTAVAGNLAWEAIRAAVGANPEPPIRVVGIELARDNKFGEHTVLVMASRPRTGVQRLGGSPGISAVHETSESAPDGREQPRPGTFWRASQGEIVAVDGIRSRQGRVEVSIRPIEDGTLGRPRYVELSSFFAEYGETETPTHLRQPVTKVQLRVGDRRWEKSTQLPCRVVGVSQGGMFIRYVRGNDDPVAVTVEDFLRNTTAEDPEPPCEVGDEMVDSNDRVVVITEILPEEAVVIGHLRGHHRSTVTISFFSLKKSYTKLNRRSALERLSDD